MLSAINIIIWVLAIVLGTALLTLLERKLLGALQRRLGPDTVGILGLLQPIADAVKLVTKQTSSSANRQPGLFYAAPAYAFCLVMLAWSVIGSLFVSTDTYAINYPSTVLPFHPSDEMIVTPLKVWGDQIGYALSSLLAYMPYDYNWLVLLAILSLTIYAQLLLGWAANSAYAFLGSLRSSAALISYELILSTAALIPMLLSQSYSLHHIIEGQVSIIYAIPLLPVFMIFLISSLAEASRVPFDLVEAESELVSGYMTEHASVAFTLLFLTEYASILLFSSLNAILWFGTSYYTNFALAVSAMLSFVILARALLPRMRYDQLISFCWTTLLPVIFVAAVAIPCLLVALSST